jgi:hypothetical protein
VIPGILIAGGTLNLVMTFTRGWAFGGVFLVVLLAVLCARAPFVWGMLPEPETITDSPLSRAWLYDGNRWYDELPPERRFWTSVVAIGVVCVVDLVLVALRAPYVSGLIESPTRRLAAPAPRQLAMQVPAPLSLGTRQMQSAGEADG